MNMLMLVRCITYTLLLWTMDSSEATDLQIGNSVNNVLAYSEYVKLSAVPLNTRTKNVFYNDTRQYVIKGISAIEQTKSGASATVTAGGVGFTFVNVRLKSERGGGLEYQIQIFV